MSETYGTIFSIREYIIYMVYLVKTQIAECDFICINNVNNLSTLKYGIIGFDFITHNISVIIFSQACIVIECGFINVNMERKQFVWIYVFDENYHWEILLSSIHLYKHIVLYSI